MTKTLVPALFMILSVTLVACKSEPTPDEYLEKARSYMASGNLETAIDTLQNALFSNPEHESLINELGTLYIRLEEWERLKVFLRLSEMSPATRAKFESEIAGYEFDNQNWRAAARHFENASEYSYQLCFSSYFTNLANAMAAHYNNERYQDVERLYVRGETLWDQLSCDEDEIVEPSSELAVSINALWDENRRAMEKMREIIAAIETIASRREQAYRSCIQSARQEYLRRWESSCAQQGRSTRQEIEYCIEQRGQRFAFLQGRAQAYEDARRYCQAAYGEPDSSAECALPQDRARRLEAQREMAERDCQTRFTN